MPVLKEKPVLSPKPPCGGCDFCGDLREDGLYLLGYSGKYYCKMCFFRVAVNWPKKAKKEQVRIDVTDEQVVRGAKIGKARHANKERKGVKDMMHSKRLSPEQAHVMGAVFEVAVADKYGLSVDESIVDGPDQFDFVLPCGCILSARCRDYQDKVDRMIVSNSKRPLDKPKADFFIWGLKRGRGFDVMGASDARDWERFRSEKIELHDFGKGQRQTVPFSRLDPVDILFNHVEAGNE